MGVGADALPKCDPCGHIHALRLITVCTCTQNGEVRGVRRGVVCSRPRRALWRSCLCCCCSSMASSISEKHLDISSGTCCGASSHSSTLRLYVELLPCYTHMMLDRAHADARVVFASCHDHPRANAKARKPHVCRHLSCRVASAPMATRRLSSWLTSCCFTLQMHFGGIVCGARSYRDLPS